MLDYLYKILVDKQILLQSLANIMTPIGIFLGIFSFWYSRRKDKLNNKPMIEFLKNEFILEIGKDEKTNKGEIVLKHIEDIEKQTFDLCVKLSNQGLNAMFIKKLKIKRIPKLRYKRGGIYETKTGELQGKKIIFPIFHERYSKDLYLEIINSNSTSLVRTKENFKISLHPIINHFVFYHSLIDYFEKGIVSKDEMQYTLLYKEIYLLTIVMKYSDINNVKYSQQIDIYTNIQPEETKYKLTLICKKK